MKKIAFIFSFLFASFFGFAQTFDTVLLLDNGPSDKRINLVILGDGYDITEQDTFITDATQLANYLFTKPPFSYYSDYFNVYAIKVISQESGVQHPGTATDVAEPVFPVSYPITYLESSFDFQDIHRCIYSFAINKISQVLAANVPFYDQAVVLVNSPEYGGCAGVFSFFSKHSSANEIMVHELGHSFSGLADEYYFAPTGERPNKTQDNNPQTNRWRNWIGTNAVDIYPHAEDPSWFRPHQACAMRYLGNPFCAVCSEATIEKIHQLLGPIEAFSPSDAVLEARQNDVNFAVDLIYPNPNTLEFTWELNNNLIDDQNSAITIANADLNEGNNSLVFSVVDNTSLVRTDNHSAIHVNTVSWTIHKVLGIEEIQTSESSFSLYPNPSADVVHLKVHNLESSQLTYELMNMTGQSIKKAPVQLNNSDSFVIDLGNLAPQTYILNIYDEHNSKLHTHKVVKK